LPNVSMQIRCVGWSFVDYFLVLNYLPYRLPVSAESNCVMFFVLRPNCRAAVRVGIGSEDLITLWNRG